MHGLFMTEDRRPTLAWRILFSLSALLLILVFCFSAPDRWLVELLHLPAQGNLYQITDNLNIAGLLLPAYVLGGWLTIWSVFWLRRHIDRRPTTGLALTTLAGHQREFVLGWLLGCFIPASAACVALLSGLLSFHLSPLNGWQVSIALLFWSANGLSSAVRDEVVLRGYILQNLGERLPLWCAVLSLALLSTAFCLFGGVPVLAWVINTLLLSAIWTCTRLLTRSLWLGISIHAGFNASTALLFVFLFHNGPTLAQNGLLAGLEIPFSAMLLAALACWMYSCHPRIHWRQHLRDEGPPVNTAVAVPLSSG
jgi:membrane protease YdiL (CAAX protease family)